MVGYRESKNAKCPYYQRHADYRICCEGETKGTSFSVTFQDDTKRKAYMKERCEGIEACRSCLIHKALNIKYGVL